MNTNGSLWIAAKLSASCTSPWLELPSPMIATATWSSLRILAASATPTAWRICVATGDETEMMWCSGEP